MKVTLVNISKNEEKRYACMNVISPAVSSYIEGKEVSRLYFPYDLYPVLHDRLLAAVMVVDGVEIECFPGSKNCLIHSILGKEV